MGKKTVSIVNGNTFSSRVEACKAYDVSYRKVNNKIDQGYSLEDAINELVARGDVLGTVKEERNDVVSVLGNDYLNLNEVARDLNIPFVSLMLLVEKHDTVEDAVNWYKKNEAENMKVDADRIRLGITTYSYRGKEYDTVEEIAKELRVSLTTLEKLRIGRSFDDVGDLIELLLTKMRKKTE